MNNEDFAKIVDATMQSTGKLLIQKNAEYAGDADCLANFKRNAAKNGQTVLETWQTYWGKHVDSINTYMARVKDKAMRLALLEVSLVSQRFYMLPEDARETEEVRKRFADAIDPSAFKQRVDAAIPAALREVDAELSEPIEGRFDDNINYSILCKAILHELRQGPKG